METELLSRLKEPIDVYCWHNAYCFFLLALSLCTRNMFSIRTRVKQPSIEMKFKVFSTLYEKNAKKEERFLVEDSAVSYYFC